MVCTAAVLYSRGTQGERRKTSKDMDDDKVVSVSSVCCASANSTG
jgi:hypothetical protein